jgi:hypothetical protein
LSKAADSDIVSVFSIYCLIYTLQCKKHYRKHIFGMILGTLPFIIENNDGNNTNRDLKQTHNFFRRPSIIYALT